MIDFSYTSKYKEWKGLFQISTVVGNSSVIEEHTRFTRMLGGSIVGVHGIWPKLRFWGGEGSRACDSYAPTDHLDDVEEKCKEFGIHFIQCQEFMFSGRQFNIAVDYIKNNIKEPEVMLWLEGDECLNMNYLDWYIDTVKTLKEEGYDGLIFPKLIELGPDRKYAYTAQSNQGFFFNKGLFHTRKTNFDGHLSLTSNKLKLIKADDLHIPPMANVAHLHIFKKYGINRVKNGVWRGGGRSLLLNKSIGNESYLNFLYDNLTIMNVDLSRKIDGYLGEIAK